MNLKRWRPELVGLVIAAFATRIWMLLTPNAVVFDEVYFKEFAAHYLDGHYYFDIHPPLGKLILAGLAKILVLDPAAMLEGTAVALRFLPAAAGILLVPLMWGILRRLGASRPFAFLGAFAILLDNAVLAESRFILMDSMLFLFGLGALYLYLRARDTTGRARLLWLSLAALSAGAAVSVKWTGLGALGLIGIVWLWDQRGRKATWQVRLGELALLGVIPLLLYASAFWMHFKLLPSSGEGDAFMSQRFQSTLKDSAYYNPEERMSYTDKFVELNREMYDSNQTLTATHPYGSHWYSWPLLHRPVYYWQGDQLDGGRQSHIYLLGNPAVWWGVWVAIISGLITLWVTKRKLRPHTVAALAIAGLAFLINFLPFVGVSRVMFLYHYFFSFFFSLIFAIMLWNDIATSKKDDQLTHPSHQRIYGAIIAIIALAFLFFSPLTYGTPLSQSELQARMWLHTWR